MLINTDTSSTHHNYLIVQTDEHEEEIQPAAALMYVSDVDNSEENIMLIANNNNIEHAFFDICTLETDAFSRSAPQSPDISTTDSISVNEDQNINSIQSSEAVIREAENLQNKQLNQQRCSPIKNCCRYCYEAVEAEEDYSCCYCHSSICKECFIRELNMTLNRQQGELKCTVCFYQYNCRFVRNLNNCCNIIRDGFAETYTLRHENGELLSTDSIHSVVGIISLLLLFPAVTVLIALYIETTVFGFLTVADLIMNWCIRIFVLRCEEFIQPIVHFILCLFHIIRVTIFLVYIKQSSKIPGDVNELYLMTALSAVYAVLYLYSTHTIFYPRYLSIMNRFALLYVENKGPFTQEEISSILDPYENVDNNNDIAYFSEDEIMVVHEQLQPQDFDHQHEHHIIAVEMH